MTQGIDILITEDLQHPALQRLEQKFSVVRDPKLWQDPARLQAQVATTRILMVRNQTQVTAALLQAAPALVGIGRVGVGLDNIDVAAATQRGVTVVAPLNANAVSVAELTLGFVLALARKIPASDRATKAGGWDRKAGTGIELDGKTLGICGFGRIGRMVATRAQAFGMGVLAYDPLLPAGALAQTASEVTQCEKLEALLTAADFVSLHLPLTPQTKKLFDAQRFAAMRRGSYFINTSRGGVVDEVALAQALASGWLAGAALDVRETEPPAAGGTLENMPNVIVTPHVGAFTTEAQNRTFEAVADDMERLLTGQPAANAVNAKR